MVRQGYLSLELSNLQPLTEGLEYKLWLVNDGKFQFVSVITPDETGNLSYEDRNLNADSLQNSDQLALSIERSGTSQREGPILLAGDWAGRYDSLNMGHSLALKNNFVTISGLYQILTPSTAATNDSLSGIWFYDTTGIDTATLNLPDLPESWSYEAWLQVDDHYLSMGKFQKKNEADDSNYYSGPLSTFNFPGEDFVKNAPEDLVFPLDVRGHKIIISIEPENDNVPDSPFYIRPLVAEIFNDAVPGELNELYRLDLKPPGGRAER